MFFIRNRPSPNCNAVIGIQTNYNVESVALIIDNQSVTTRLLLVILKIIDVSKNKTFDAGKTVNGVARVRI
jgi:hypothetical protein